MSITFNNVTFGGGLNIESAPPPSSMVVAYTTVGASNSVAIPLKGTVDVLIDWGDGNVSNVKTAGYANKTYATSGLKTITITGTLTGYGLANREGAAFVAQLRRIDSFGTVGLTDLSGAFFGALSLTNVPNTLPSTVTNLALTFGNASIFNDANVANWNTQSVSNMQGTFANATAFNANIASWDTRNVTDMSRMFDMASSGTKQFNQPIGNWNTSNVANMANMFTWSSNFNQSLANWDVSNVTNMANMFQNMNAFNGNITTWNTSKVTNMSRMFAGSPNFNQNLNSWDVGNVANTVFMFWVANSFNGDISSWNTAKLTNAVSMFEDARSFNSNIANWNVSNVTRMDNMFKLATSFNQPISNWNTGNVTNMSNMFAGATATKTIFNQPLGNWNTSKIPNAASMEAMFANNNSFNQDLTSWCVSNIGSFPSSFVETSFPLANRPLWGTCPNSYVPQPITFVGAVANAGNTATLPAHISGDTIVIFAYNAAANSNVTNQTGWTPVSRGNTTGGDWIGTYSGTGSYIVSYRTASNSSTPANIWPGATNVIYLVYRNVDNIDTVPVSSPTILGVNPAIGNSSSNVITYPINQYYYDQSWAVSFAGHRSIDGNMQVAPTGMTLRANSSGSGNIGQAVAFDTNDMYGKWPNTSVTIGGTANSWLAATIRLVGKPTV